MNKLTDKCCAKCIDSEFQRCPKFTECLTKRPLPECHEDEECVAKRNAVIHKIRYGNGILLKLSACSYHSDVEIGNIISTIFTELRWRELSQVSLTVTGGLGNFSDAPFLAVSDPRFPTVVYARITADMIPRIITEHLEQKHVVEEWVFGQFPEDEKKPIDSIPIISYSDFFRSQNLRVLQRCGRIDPNNLDEFFLEDGFLALSKALNRMTPGEVANLVGISGLRGRGGSDEYLIEKWMRMSADESDEEADEQPLAPMKEKYLICNAHEGYGPAVKDRNIMESDPFALIEGMVVTAYAVRATQGIIYLNPSYDLALKRLQSALDIARDNYYLGAEILGTDFSFDIEIRRAPSGFLAGEETSIVSFLEGEIGTKPVPPYLEETGLWGKPTLIHNVETLVNIALLVHHDFSWFTSAGLNENPGTKCLTVTGAVQYPGIIEVSLGTTLREIVSEICGGAIPDRPIKALHIGGPLGGYLTPDHFDTSFDHDALDELGVRMGTGTIEVLDRSVCLVDRVRRHFWATARELCGQCTAGREGMYQIATILQAICDGQEIPGYAAGASTTLGILQELAEYVQHSSLCVYCQYATSSLLTSMHYFHREYEEHLQKRCQAGTCF
jgi:NADH:ubiquinone oxidoreductase subunit F (NADH-binding)/(2Fe-2S) ferredoxin